MLAREGAARGKAGRVCLRGRGKKGKCAAMGDGDALASPIPLVAAGSRFGDWGLRAFIA